MAAQVRIFEVEKSEWKEEALLPAEFGGSRGGLIKIKPKGCIHDTGWWIHVAEFTQITFQLYFNLQIKLILMKDIEGKGNGYENPLGMEPYFKRSLTDTCI